MDCTNFARKRIVAHRSAGTCSEGYTMQVDSVEEIPWSKSSTDSVEENPWLSSSEFLRSKEEEIP